MVTSATSANLAHTDMTKLLVADHANVTKPEQRMVTRSATLPLDSVCVMITLVDASARRVELDSLDSLSARNASVMRLV